MFQYKQIKYFKIRSDLLCVKYLGEPEIELTIGKVDYKEWARTQKPFLLAKRKEIKQKYKIKTSKWKKLSTTIY